MIRIFFGTSLIFLMFGGGFAASLVSFINIESIFLWKNETYDNVVSYWLMAKEFSNMTMRELDQMMIEVKTLSEHYNEFTNDLREKQVENWKLSVDRRRRTEFFSPVKFELSTLINKHVTKSNDYITEIEIAEKKFTKRVTDYYNHIYKGMFSMPREIHRCEIQFPKRGENFLELTHAHQIWLITSGHLMGDEHLYRLNCYKRCEKIDPKWMGIITDLQINDCETLGLAQFIKSCPAGAKSSRRYMWWTYDGKIYGHDEGCPTALQNGNGDTPYYDQCHICQCTVIPQNDEAYPNSILRISITAQVSDIKNNMIVSGIKFVIYKNVLHLQIQQSKFVLKNINDNSSEWKSLESSQSYLNNSKIQTEMLSKFSGQIYLDDVMLPPKYAVTGVRFRSRSQSPEGFFLQVLGAPIDLETGRLNIIKANWYSANPILSKTKSYERNRIEINVKNLDDPIRCKGYDYDRTANNYIKFYHSSVLKDGGQSTVPFIDAQPVETYPPFPLGGIGLFYRSKDGCGGYITPRIFTIDISSYN
ncbi:hypothetical protein PV326_010049 [Microctonus aethiopoides]|nr:hypothetical protein PV326_010049 [Microctonus aethiopoides]